MSHKGRGVPQNYGIALKWYRLAAEQGDTRAKILLARPQKKIAVQKSFTTSVRNIQKGMDAAKRGDFATALHEWKPLAEKGNANAQFNLGLMYAEGKGVPQNLQAAVKWHQLSSKQGFVFAQSSLDVMYQEGQGVSQNYKTAAKQYTLAAGQGNAKAQNNLGYIYGNGLGTSQDFIRAYMWWQIAASQGYKIAIEGRDMVEKRMTPTQLKKA